MQPLACRLRCAAAAAPEFKSPDAFGVRYGVGNAGGTSCPTGMVTMPIAGAASCERAAAVAGRPYGGNLTSQWSRDYMPLGCVWYSAGGIFYFTATFHAGRGHASVQPVCAGAPASAQQQLSVDRTYVCMCLCVYLCVPVCAYNVSRVWKPRTTS
jgi:hypothetical protein